MAALARGSCRPAPDGLLPVSDWLQGQLPILAIYLFIYISNRDFISM
jgi:hypothetical protein